MADRVGENVAHGGPVVFKRGRRQPARYQLRSDDVAGLSADQARAVRNIAVYSAAAPHDKDSIAV